MTTMTPKPAATPVSVTMPMAFMPMAMKPAVSPASSAGRSPRRSMLQPPTIHSIPSAMHELMTGM